MTSCIAIIRFTAVVEETGSKGEISVEEIEDFLDGLRCRLESHLEVKGEQNNIARQRDKTVCSSTLIVCQVSVRQVIVRQVSVR